jgi:hypothetical protein
MQVCFSKIIKILSQKNKNKNFDIKFKPSNLDKKVLISLGSDCTQFKSLSYNYKLRITLFLFITRIGY